MTMYRILQIDSHCQHMLQTPFHLLLHILLLVILLMISIHLHQVAEKKVLYTLRRIAINLTRKNHNNNCQINYPSHDIHSPYIDPNFQSNPSFIESSLPAAPSHSPYQGSDASYSTTSEPSTTNYPSNGQYNSSDRNESAAEAEKPPAKTSQSDSNYQPPPEKITEAHKATRFALLAFDDVPTAVNHLKKSLELLTNPSAEQ